MGGAVHFWFMIGFVFLAFQHFVSRVANDDQNRGIFDKTQFKLTLSYGLFSFSGQPVQNVMYKLAALTLTQADYLVSKKNSDSNFVKLDLHKQQLVKNNWNQTGFNYSQSLEGGASTPTVTNPPAAGHGRIQPLQVFCMCVGKLNAVHMLFILPHAIGWHHFSLF